MSPEPPGSNGKRTLAPLPQRQFNLRITNRGLSSSEDAPVQKWRDRIVVTGGAGFIGSHLVDALLEAEAGEVVALDNLSRGRVANLERHDGDPRLRFVQADVRDPHTVHRALDGAGVVYHLAAQATVMGAAGDIDTRSRRTSSVLTTCFEPLPSRVSSAWYSRPRF